MWKEKHMHWKNNAHFGGTERRVRPCEEDIDGTEEREERPKKTRK